MQQQTLFDDQELLHLPQDLMEYTPGFLSGQQSNELMLLLLNTVQWQQHKVMMYDKEFWVPRLSAWYGDYQAQKENKSSTFLSLPELLYLKHQVETHTGMRFNGVLLNYYRDGNDSVAWHSDNDTLPGLKTEIASISIGEERNFDFRHKDNHRRRHSIKLQHGSLLLMKGDLQRYWEHRIAKSSRPMKGRINLTFRKVIT